MFIRKFNVHCFINIACVLFKLGLACLSLDLYFSDLDPVQAPHWCARIRVQDNTQCLLCKFLKHLY